MVISVATQTCLLLLVLHFALFTLVISQTPTFLNIDCGGDGPSTDGIGREWVADDGYITTGENLAVKLTAGPGQEVWLTSRYFPEKRSKHCYVLPAEAGSSYLIIAAFLHGGSEDLPLPVRFDVTVNSNHWLTHTADVGDPDLNTPWNYESILYNERDHIDVCFKAAKSGLAWVSSLQLRQLPEGVYPIAKENRLLTTMFRYNTGTTLKRALRWPDDELDRSWYPFPDMNITKLANDSALTVRSVFPIGFNRPPPAVMADALFAPELELDLTLTPTAKEIYYAIYFQVIRDISSVSVSNPVSMEVSSAGQSLSFNLTSGLSFQVFGNTTVTDTSVTLAVTPGPGQVGDVFLNALEAYELTDINASFTLQSDVSALQLLQTSFGLSSWTGDPCYSVPYDWIECDENSRITVLKLSNKNITGTIPSGIGELTRLREIYLDNNELTGTIPISLSTLPDLTVLSLDNNNLSGSVPTSLLKDGFSFSGNPALNICKPNDTACIVIPDPSKKSSGTNIGLIIGVAIGVVIAILAVVACLCYLWRRKQKEKASGSLPVNEPHRGEAASFGQAPSMGSNFSLSSRGGYSNAITSNSRMGSNDTTPSSAKSNVHQVAGFMSITEVINATNNFQRRIGEGGYGPVFYGQLSNEREVAVKVNKVGAHQGNDEFVNEVALLTRVHHKNLVSLLGFCEEENQRVLVYEYLHNGTLSDLLYGPNAANRPLPWKTRLELALDAARGLEYLHTGCNPRIIHRDVKSSNILIDDKMVAKVADFGISKAAPDLQSTISGQMSTMVRGTPGYLDPEYFMLQKLSQKSDVYSFGVVLIEIISGRRPISANPDGSTTNLTTLLLQCMQTGDMASLADPSLKGDYNPESMWKVAELAWSSVDQKGAKRPDMAQVVRGLAEAYDMELTYDPNYSSMSVSFKLSAQR